MSIQPAKGGRPIRLLLLEPDPYLAFLIHIDLPEAEVLEADPADAIDELVGLSPDLVIVDLESPRAREFMTNRGGIPMIGIADGVAGSRSTGTPAGSVLLRPFDPPELHRKIRETLGLPELATSGPSSRLHRAHWLLGPARLVSVCLAAVFELAGSPSDRSDAWLFLVMFTYVALRLLHKRTSPLWALSDTAVAAVLLGFTGGVTSNYAGFAFVAAIQAGLVLTPGFGVLAGAIVAAGAVPELMSSGLSTASMRQYIASLSLFPLSAWTGSLAARTWGLGGRELIGKLTEANRVLSSLFRIARALPVGLDIKSVSKAALDQMKESMASPAGAILVGDADLIALVASYGMSPVTEGQVQKNASAIRDIIHSKVLILDEKSVPENMASMLKEYGCWSAVPLTVGGTKLGIAMAACSDHSRHNENRLFMQHLAEETAVALENARLFDRVRELAVDEERVRLAKELHDGVAQALTHVRLELDFVNRHAGADDPALKSELTRLTGVLDRAVGEVRSSILTLRSTVSADGLAGSLRSYLQDLRGIGSINITFRARGAARFPHEVEAEMFRMTQDLMAGMFRSPDISWIEVTLEATSFALKVIVDLDAEKKWSIPQSVLDRLERLGGTGVSDMRASAARVEMIIEASQAFVIQDRQQAPV